MRKRHKEKLKGIKSFCCNAKVIRYWLEKLDADLSESWDVCKKCKRIFN